MIKLLSPILLILLLLLGLPSQVFAGYDSFKLAQALGGYIVVTNLLEQFSNSPQCGYAVKKQYSTNSVMQEGIKYFNDQDRNEFLGFVEESLEKIQQNNSEFIEGGLQAGKKDNLDEKTICGILLSNTAHIYQNAKLNWEEAVKIYSE